ncbi:TPA: hypothetical protein NV459_001540 [Citrobacter freundii]|nr:DUF3387 domain-containing protein [Citrobacter freundii]HCJ7728620.1 hypothetical protein [Citrobacter freundii]
MRQTLRKYKYPPDKTPGTIGKVRISGEILLG